ncbi:S-protein homolog 31 [Linum grandiflorum]
MTSKILSLAAVVATFLLATAIPPSSANYFHRETYHLHIINELSGNKVLWAQCNCIDRAQPVTYVGHGTDYMLTFKEHIFRTTRWSCYLIKDNNSHVWFVAFHDYIQTSNNNVYWAVKEDGVYFRLPGVPDDLQFHWKAGR